MTQYLDEILDFEDDGGTYQWRVRNHSALRRHIRWVRSLPGIVQIIIVQFWLAYALIIFFVSWLVAGALFN